MPSQAIAAAQNGDTILIDPATYTDDFAPNVDTMITANNLTLMGVGGMPHILQDYVPSSLTNNRGLWNITGSNTTIENIEFSGASRGGSGSFVNDSGVFAEADTGTNVTILNCYFHDNQEGILIGDNASSTITIEHTEFNHNGVGGTGYAHNLYLNHVASLIFTNNYTHNVLIGHEIKSRASINYIAYNRIMDESVGTGSYDVDIPNGGQTYLIGNLIEKGPNAQNNTIITYAEEGATNPVQQLYAVNNTIVNDLGSGTFIRVSAGSPTTVISNNFFVGGGTLISGGMLNGGNVSTSTPNFIDGANYDYHLESTSQAIDQGVSVGSVNGVSLTPTEQYFDPLTSEPRVVGGAAIDAGAYEYLPEALLIATPSFVHVGLPTTLSWSSTDADSCIGSNFSTGAATSGSATITPSSSTTYSVSCSSAYGTSTASAMVTVENAPTVTVQAASSLTSTTATLNGTITADGSATITSEGFNYGGITADYGSTASSTGSFSAGAFTQNISGLTCNTNYHFEAVASNAVGTSTSADQAFTTSACPVASGGGPIVGLIGSAGGTYHGVGYVASRPQIDYPNGAAVYLDVPQTTSNTTAPTTTPFISPVVLLKNRQLWDIGAGIRTLQKFLNSHGFVLAKTGSGSPGKETFTFGPLTYKALKAFQKAIGLPQTGYLGPLTRVAILEFK